jgi:transcriptional regulator with XRE-family HTH domain
MCYSFDMANEFIDWLMAETRARGWTDAELARRAELSPATISLVFSRQKGVGLDFCIGVARALGEQPERILRRAGLLPPLPAAVEEENEVLQIYRTLPATQRRTILSMLRALAPREVRPTPAEGQSERDHLIQELLREFRKVPDEWKEIAISEVIRMRRMAETRSPRIIGDDEETESDEAEEEKNPAVTSAA